MDKSEASHCVIVAVTLRQVPRICASVSPLWVGLPHSPGKDMSRKLLSFRKLNSFLTDLLPGLSEGQQVGYEQCRTGTYNRGNWAAQCRPRQCSPVAPRKSSLQRWPVERVDKLNDYTPLHLEWQVVWQRRKLGEMGSKGQSITELCKFFINSTSTTFKRKLYCKTWYWH